MVELKLAFWSILEDIASIDICTSTHHTRSVKEHVKTDFKKKFGKA